MGRKPNMGCYNYILTPSLSLSGSVTNTNTDLKSVNNCTGNPLVIMSAN